MRAFLSAAAAMAVLVLAPAGAASTDTPCVGALPPGTYENVVVPPGASCDLAGSTVRGNVKAFEGSRLTMAANVVGGDVQASRSAQIDVGCPPGGACGVPNTIGGNIELEEIGASPFGSGVRVCGASVHGNVSVIDSPTPNISVGLLFGCPGNAVGGNIVLQRNTAGGFYGVGRNVVGGELLLLENELAVGPLSVQSNRLGGDLQAKGNRSGSAIHLAGNELSEGNLQVANNVAAESVAVGGFTPNLVGGNLEFTKNVAAQNSVNGNQVAQNLQFFHNRAATTNQVTNNWIGDTLSCFDNAPPGASAGNIAGKREGECVA